MLGPWKNAVSHEDIEDMFAALRPITIKAMFGGKGIYHQGLIVACAFDGDVVLKADAVSGPVFEAAGAQRWSYEGKGGKVIMMPYWSIPDDAYDDPDQMAGWVRLAFEAALRDQVK